jgi:creatinine amidohydrolase
MGQARSLSGRPWVLAETNWKTVIAERCDVAVLPWGATEAHNLHLPYGTDNIETEAVAAEAARLAWERGARIVVLPGIPFGVNTGQLDIPFCVNMNPSTQMAVLSDVVHSLESEGLRKLVILNGHGANDFRQMIRELQPLTSVFISAVAFYKVVDAAKYFAEPGDHAGELETSLIMHLAPHLPLPLSDAGPGRERKSRLRAIREGWAWAPRQWSKVTDDTGVGDPKAASAEKGRQYYEAVTRKIADYFVELMTFDPAQPYEE